MGDALGYLPARLLPAVVSFAAIYVYTRLLSAGEYGVYGLIMGILAPITVALTEWAAQPLGRFYAEYEAQDQRGLYGRVLTRLSALVLPLSGAVGFAVALIGYPHWGAVAIPVALLIPLQALTHLFSPILPASLDRAHYRLIESARPLIAFVVATALLLLVSRSAAAIFWGLVLANALMLAPLLRRVRIAVGPSVADAGNRVRSTMRRFVRFGVPMAAWFFAAGLLAMADRYLIQWFLGSDAVGVYTANYSLMNGVSAVAYAPVLLAAFPVIVKVWAEGRRDELEEMLKNMTGLFLILAGALFGGVAVVDRDLAHVVLGEQFRGGYPIFLPVVGGLLIWQATMLGHKGLELQEKTWVMLVFAVVAAVVNLVLNWIYIPLYGYIAAAFTTLVSYTVYAVLVWIFSLRGIRWLFPGLLSVKIIAGTVLAAWVATLLPSEGDWTSLISRGLVFVAVYSLLLTLMARHDIRLMLVPVER